MVRLPNIKKKKAPETIIIENNKTNKANSCFVKSLTSSLFKGKIIIIAIKGNTIPHWRTLRNVQLQKKVLPTYII